MLALSGRLQILLLLVGRLDAADLDITGAPARIRFLDALDNEHAVLEGGEGWLNASTRMAAVDYVTMSGSSLEEMGRRLTQAQNSTGLLQIISSQQDTISSQQDTIASMAATIAELTSLQPRGDPLPAGSFVVAPGIGSYHLYLYSISGNNWSRLEPPMPHPRLSATLAIVDGYLYAFGGVLCDASEVYGVDFATDCIPKRSSVHRYPLAGGSWSEVSPLPNTTSSATGDFGSMQAFALDGFIYTVYHLSNQQTLVRYNPTSDVWEPRAKSSRAGLQRDMAYAVHGGYIYSSGGCCDSNSLVDRYDPNTNTWTSRASMSVIRTAHGLFGVGDYLYAISGLGTPMLTSVERHDPLSDSWSARASMPYGLAMHHYGGYPIAEFMGDIYIFGGWSDSSPAWSGPILKYNTTANQWQTITTSLPFTNARYYDPTVILVPA